MEPGDLAVRNRDLDHKLQLASRSDDDADISVDENRASSPGTAGDHLPGNGLYAVYLLCCAACGSPVVPEHDIRVEHLEQRVEVACARRRKEGVDQLPLPRQIGVPGRVKAMYPAAGAAGQLPGCFLGTPHDRGDFLKRQRENVMQNECDLFGRIQAAEHDEHGEADGVGQQRLTLGVADVPAA